MALVRLLPAFKDSFVGWNEIKGKLQQENRS